MTLNQLPRGGRQELGCLRTQLLFFVVVMLTALHCCAVAAEVTLDVANKKASSDDKTIEALAVRVQGAQVGVYVQNHLMTPQSFTLKTPGLTEPKYDVYINGQHSGVKTREELESGIRVELAGCVVDPDLLRCLYAMRGRMEPLYERYKNLSSEERRVAATLDQAIQWVRSGIAGERNHRAASIVFVPTDRAMQKMLWRTRYDAEETARGTARACWLLMRARDRMNMVITNSEIRNNAVVALTPVDLTANYTIKDGKPRIESKLVNNCDRPITGSFAIAVPSGWKQTSKQLKFTDLKSGKTHTVVFDLTPSKPDTPLPDKFQVSVTAEVRQDRLFAKFTLKADATKPN
jgi:hypothetical protein